MAFLIINADDFGKDLETNRAVSIAKEEGILTSASLMVIGERWEEAAEISKEKNLDIGLHASITEGKSILLRKKINISPFWIGLKAQFCSSSLMWIKKEIELQCKRFASIGLPFSHINSHHHIHIHPQISRLFLKACLDYKIKAIRIPHEIWSISRPVLTLKNICYRIIFSLLTASLTNQVNRTQLFFPNAVFGLYMTSRITEEWIEGLLERLASVKGIYELYFHPVDKKGSPGFRELQILTNSRIREKIHKLGIKLISFSEASIHA